MRSLSLALFAVAGIALTASPARGQVASSCIADLDSVETIVRRDYAGYRVKEAARSAELGALSDSVRADARSAATDAACTTALQRWIRFFRDPHLQIGDVTPPPATPAAGAATRESTTVSHSGSAASAGTPSVDRRRPTLAFPNDSTALLSLGDFGDRYKPAIDSLIAAHRVRLLATPYLVIDVRRNGGGWTGSYEAVLPLLYTDPIEVHGMEVWASEGNTAYLKSLLASNRAEGIKRAIRPLVPQMEARPGQFITIMENRTVRFDSVHAMPRAVAIVVGRGCVSTCEQFVLDARQSRKVSILGTGNTGGFVDYGNARGVRLPSNTRDLHVPSARSKRLPEISYDVLGITPGVHVPAGAGDPLEFAQRYLWAKRP